MRRLGLLCFLSSILIGVCAAQTPKASAPAEIAVHAGKVLDVRTGNYLTDQIIWIEGDRIKAIGKAAEISSQLPAGATVIDLSHATVLPGLIDCHTHLGYRADRYDEIYNFKDTPFDSAFFAVVNARKTLEAGFTSVRDVGS